MANILNIDTSTEVCSVALATDGEVVLHHEDYNGRNHAQLLSGFIESAMKYVHSREIKLDAIAVSIGPGSYTGLRIGLSEAKGLCFGLGIPLIGINTLQIMVVGVMFNHEIDEESLFIPMIDARRMEVFTGVYDLSLNELLQPCPLILEEGSLNEYINTGRKIILCGNGSDKALDILAGENITHIPRVKPVAVDMPALSERAFRNNDFIDVAYSTPQYLKEFQATTPKKAI